MAGRGRTSYQKRQKEQLRLEKRQQKAARKEARKSGALIGPSDEDHTLEEFTDEDSPRGLGASEPSV